MISPLAPPDDVRDPRIDPRHDDEVALVYSSEYGVQEGRHTLPITSRHPRHVHYRHVWPDGVVCTGSMWLSEWRSFVRDAEIVRVAQ